MTVSTSEPIQMKVSCQRTIGFYTKSALSFIRGVPAKEGKEAKPGVERLNITGLGNACHTAVAAASRCERERVATIEKVETNYIEVDSDGDRVKKCPQIVISMLRHPDADKIKEDDLKEDEEE